MKSHAGFLPRTLSTAGHFSLGRLLLGSWQQICRWHALYRQRQRLAALSDEMLKDIGLSRADVEAESARPFWDEPSRR